MQLDQPVLYQDVPFQEDVVLSDGGHGHDQVHQWARPRRSWTHAFMTATHSLPETSDTQRFEVLGAIFVPALVEPTSVTLLTLIRRDQTQIEWQQVAELCGEHFLFRSYESTYEYL
eukprot:850492-Amphidinium_carterae.1